jgi:hypothetical protein
MTRSARKGISPAPELTRSRARGCGAGWIADPPTSRRSSEVQQMNTPTFTVAYINPTELSTGCGQGVDIMLLIYYEYIYYSFP